MVENSDEIDLSSLKSKLWGLESCYEAEFKDYLPREVDEKLECFDTRREIASQKRGTLDHIESTPNERVDEGSVVRGRLSKDNSLKGWLERVLTRKDPLTQSVDQYLQNSYNGEIELDGDLEVDSHNEDNELRLTGDLGVAEVKRSGYQEEELEYELEYEDAFVVEAVPKTPRNFW